MSVFIEKITIKNLLSFDEEGITDFELKPLNVLIGANASGKSNFVTSLNILASFAEYNVRDYLLKLGGMAELLNKKSKLFDSTFESLFRLSKSDLRVLHKIKFGEIGNSFSIDDEELLVYDGVTLPMPWTPIDIPVEVKGKIAYQIQLPPGEDMHYAKANLPAFLYPEAGDPQIPVIIDGKPGSLSASNFYDRSRSLFQFGPHSSVTELRDSLRLILYRGFYPVFGPLVLQTPNEAGVQQDYLVRDASNLASYLAVLNERMIVDHFILPKVAELYPKITGIGTTIRGGRVFITIKERGNKQVTLQPRVSDGLLRFIAILSVLYQENPPPLLCLEEPENGLHPEVIHVLAKALIEASERTQIVVTTHSSQLIDYLDPEHVVICEREKGVEGGTKLHRLDPVKMNKWLKDFSLGDLWLSGEFGGMRY